MPSGGELSVLCRCHWHICVDSASNVSAGGDPHRSNLLSAAERTQRMENAIGYGDAVPVFDGH